MIAPKHILGTFDEALSSLRNNVLMMSSLTERSLDRAITGLLQRDDDLCAVAIADDEEILELCRKPKAAAIGIPGDRPRHVGSDDFIFLRPIVEDRDEWRHVRRPLYAADLRTLGRLCRSAPSSGGATTPSRPVKSARAEAATEATSG